MAVNGSPEPEKGTRTLSDFTNVAFPCKQEEADKKNKGKKEPNGRPPSWKTTFSRFARTTTLHGIRFAVVEKLFFGRRFLWLALFMTCSVLMSVQIVERIVHYYSYPVSVNVHVNYNKTLQFPALTICNQNAFRATAAVQFNFYRLIEDTYASNASVSPTDLDKFRARAITLDQLFKITAHKKEDLIVGCKWQDEKCGPENFTQVLTDHGVCYTFNDDPEKPLWVTSAAFKRNTISVSKENNLDFDSKAHRDCLKQKGSDYGLKLTLNVEQYEYMPGPHNSAGVKMLLHSKKEFPKVAELGLAVSTGTHAYVGMQLLWIQNLPKPHGSCRSEKSPYYDQYSPDACQVACMTQRLEQVCGCRHMHMPHINGYPPICTLEQFLFCYQKKIGTVRDYVRDHCDCPVPCDFLIYDPTISFASTSMYATDRLLGAATATSLTQKFIKARETTSRQDRFKFQEFIHLEQNMRSNFNDLKTAMNVEASSRIRAQSNVLLAIHKTMEDIRTRKKYLTEWQIYHVKKNFMRARTAMEERTLDSLMHGYQEYSFHVESRIYQMANPPNNVAMFEQVRSAIYMEVMNMLNGKIDLADRAYDNYTQLYDAFYNGTPIFRYQFKNEPRDDNVYVTPKPLLRDSLFRTSYTRKYSKRVGNDINQIKEWLQTYSTLANTSYFNKTANSYAIHMANINFLNRGRRFFNSKSVFYTESIEYPVRVLEDKLASIEKKWQSFDDNFQRMSGKVDQLLVSLGDLKKTILSRLQNYLDIAQIYIRHGNVTKLRVAQDLTSEEIHNGLSELKNFFHEFRSRGQEVYDGWKTLLASTNQLWALVLGDENQEEYCSYKNWPDFLQNYSDVATETEKNFMKYRNEYDFRFLLGTLDNQFLMSLNTLTGNMKEYIDSNGLDADFIKKSFLQLDVFYREKSYEQITQQEAYDKFALFCDIGGSMGLFVGASVLTLYEIIDMLFHHSFLLLTHGTSLPAWLKKWVRNQ